MPKLKYNTYILDRLIRIFRVSFKQTDQKNPSISKWQYLIVVVEVQSLLDNFNFCIFVFTWTAVSGWQIVTMTDYSEGKWNIQQLLISRNMDWNHYSFVWLEWGKKHEEDHSWKHSAEVKSLWSFQLIYERNVSWSHALEANERNYK